VTPRHRVVVTLLAIACWPSGVAVAGPGGLDPSFDSDGRVTIDYDGWARGDAPTLHARPGGELLVASELIRVTSEVERAVGLTRLAADGRVVRSAVTEVDAYLPLTPAVRHGEGLVVGATTVSEQLRLLRFGAGDAPDAGFGAGGVATIAPGRADRLAVQHDDGQDKIVAASAWVRKTHCGEDDFGCAYESGVRLLRVDAHGELDPSFGDSGRVERTLLGPEGCLIADVTDLESLPDGDLLVAYRGRYGQSTYPCWTPSASPRFAYVTRLDAAQGYAEDPSFGRREIRPANTHSIYIADADVARDGRILVAGDVQSFEGSGMSEHAWIARLDASSGALDTSFGDGGMRLLALRWATAIEQQPDGPIVMATLDPAQRGLAVTRLTEDGAADEAFGVAVADFGRTSQVATSTTVVGDRIVVAGTAGELDEPLRTSVARFLTAPDPSPPPRDEPAPPDEPTPPPRGPRPPPLVPMVRELLPANIPNPLLVDRRARFRVPCVTRGLTGGTCTVVATPARRSSKSRRTTPVTLARGAAPIGARLTRVTLTLTKAGRRALRRRGRPLRVILTTRATAPGILPLRRTDRAGLLRWRPGRG
jgi:uncharacterized delta-60 repeat protein